MEYKNDINFAKAKRGGVATGISGISKTLGTFSVGRGRGRMTNEEKVLEEIRKVCTMIDAVASQFEMECDNDLIDACIYEMEALRARYRYLIKHAKAEGVTAGERLEQFAVMD